MYGLKRGQHLAEWLKLRPQRRQLFKLRPFFRLLRFQLFYALAKRVALRLNGFKLLLGTLRGGGEHGLFIIWLYGPACGVKPVRLGGKLPKLFAVGQFPFGNKLHRAQPLQRLQGAFLFAG